jgi:hypothetical protein
MRKRGYGNIRSQSLPVLKFRRDPPRLGRMYAGRGLSIL